MTLTQSADHETALAAGFDIVGAGRWVRPDRAELWRTTGRVLYIGRRSDGRDERFYTMAEAVEWIGPVRP